MQKALFIDRDGVVNVDKGYVHRAEDFVPIKENIELIKKLAGDGDSLIFIVTNQAGIARGYYTEDDFLRFQKWVEDYLLNEGVKIEKTYYCPHHIDGSVVEYKKECDCRKPKTGMFLTAQKEYDLDLKNSVFIGDMDSDELAGEAIGCKFIRV